MTRKSDDSDMPAPSTSTDRHTDWMEILKVFAMPLVITVVGLVINSSLNERQSKESNIRLYADMMARREDADSNLRKDMFTHILSVVTEEKPPPKSVGHLQYLEQQVVDLELMAYNFNESIDLGPLFQHLRRKISDGPKDAPAGQQRYDDLRQRLERLAVEVGERQLTVVGDTGTVVRALADNLTQMPEAPANILFVGPSAIPTAGARPDDDVNQVCLGLYAPDDNEKHYRRFRLEVVELEPVSREVRVRLYVSRPVAEQECRSVDFAMNQNQELDILFWVGVFDVPMIDNTRLTHSERCSVSLTRLSKDNAAVALAYFPSSRASLKDKPYYDELEHDLLHKESREPTKGRS